MHTENLRPEVCIVGAGPAGATTSLFLAQMGIPHLIVDAARFPRDKICGDGLDLKVVRVLRHLSPDIVHHELPAHEAFLPVRGARFILQNGRHCDFTQSEAHVQEAPLFWCARRFHFDHFLVQKIDLRFADFRQETEVKTINRDGTHWRIEAQQGERALHIETPLLIGADGDHSVVLRALGDRKIDRRHYAGTVRQYWQGVADLAPGNLLEIYFPKGLPMSYFYIFPLPGGMANVGYGMVSEVLARQSFKLRDLFQQLIERDPYLAPRFRAAQPLEKPIGWGLPLASRRRRAFGDGYLLTGDAASLVCPTTGEGIGTGMMSGYIAAHFIRRALARKCFDADIFRHYDREIYRRLHSEIRTYRYMMQLSPRLYDWGLNLLAPNPIFQGLFRRQVGGWLKTAYETPIEVQMD